MNACQVRDFGMTPAWNHYGGVAFFADVRANSGVAPWNWGEEPNAGSFEGDAGEKGGKLLPRSVPSVADVFINDLLVVRTPLLIATAPGLYRIDRRSARDNSGHVNVGVMPQATRAVAIELKQEYPPTISIH